MLTYLLINTLKSADSDSLSILLGSFLIEACLQMLQRLIRVKDHDFLKNIDNFLEVLLSYF